ncbi:MAG: hypothetical protein IAE91_07215 [Ignavibacteriaceae bacterium]|nr:hypothetical protein [Ignavibacteriaceae bacterium]
MKTVILYLILPLFIFGCSGKSGDYYTFLGKDASEFQKIYGEAHENNGQLLIEVSDVDRLLLEVDNNNKITYIGKYYLGYKTLAAAKSDMGKVGQELITYGYVKARTLVDTLDGIEVEFDVFKKGEITVVSTILNPANTNQEGITVVVQTL